MTKLRKQRRRKKYNYNVNRKRLRNKIEGVGKITCKEINEAWERSKSLQANFKEMGLSYDPNKTIKIPNVKKKLAASMLSNDDNEWVEESTEDEAVPTKGYVVEALEKDAKAPRVKLFRLPKGQVEWITYLMDKYKTDYKAMARDKKNYYQETWKQIRQKIRRFKSIPEQYHKYLKERGLSESYFEDDGIVDEDSD